MIDRQLNRIRERNPNQRRKQVTKHTTCICSPSVKPIECADLNTCFGIECR